MKANISPHFVSHNSHSRLPTTHRQCYFLSNLFSYLLVIFFLGKTYHFFCVLYFTPSFPHFSLLTRHSPFFKSFSIRLTLLSTHPLFPFCLSSFILLRSLYVYFFFNFISPSSSLIGLFACLFSGVFPSHGSN